MAADRRPGRGRAAVVGLALLLVGAAAASERDRPTIVDVAAPPRLRVDVAADVRLTYRAPRANVVAVVVAVEDLDGPVLARATRERALGVVARAFGYETGELRVPISFATPGLKRVTLRLVTDEREESDPAMVEVEVSP